MTARGVLLGSPAQEPAQEVARRLQTLIRVGGRLAVLGVDERRAGGWWHVVRPGSFTTPAGNEGLSDLTHGSALCTDPRTGKARIVVTNGYAADWRPPQGQLCPACAEQCL